MLGAGWTYSEYSAGQNEGPEEVSGLLRSLRLRIAAAGLNSLSSHPLKGVGVPAQVISSMLRGRSLLAERLLLGSRYSLPVAKQMLSTKKPHLGVAYGSWLEPGYLLESIQALSFLADFRAASGRATPLALAIESA